MCRQQPIRSLVTWRNFTRLYLRFIKIEDNGAFAGPQPYRDDIYLQKLLQLPVYRSVEQSLPDLADYHTHSTEIALASLPVGNYLLLASSDGQWTGKKAEITVSRLYVSAISYINLSEDFFVLNRESGQPMAGAKVQVWKEVYDSKIQGSRFSKDEVTVSRPMRMDISGSAIKIIMAPIGHWISAQPISRTIYS